MCSSRNIYRDVFDKKSVLNNLTGKHLCRSLFLDKAAGWRPETLLKEDFSTGIFLCIFWNNFWFELFDILLLLVDIFLMVLLLLLLPYQIPVKPSLTPLGKRKAVFTLLDTIFQNNVYVLLKFDWLIIFFLVNPPRKLKILNFSRLHMFSSKIRRSFLPRGNFNWMKNDL